MIGRALSADWLKIRGKGVWFLVFLGPLGLAAMQALNFGLRYDYLVNRYGDDLWGTLLDNLADFVPVALFLGATLLCSLIGNVEHQMSSWKQLLALPISRTSVFLSKLILTLSLLAVSCVLLSVSAAALGWALGFPLGELPVVDLIRLGFVSYAAALPAVSLQLWMSLSFRNQGWPVTIGVFAAVFSLFAGAISEYIPLAWPALAWSGPHKEWFAGGGAALGLLLLLPFAVHFARKDVA